MRKTAGLFLLLLWLLVPHALAAGVTVAVNPEATVAGPDLTLGDLARITGEDTARVQMLKLLKLGSAPPPGMRMNLTPETLGERLVAQSADWSDITWQVPPLITITTASQTVKGEAIAARAKEAIIQRLGAGGADSDVMLAVLATPPDALVPLGKVDFNVDIPYGIRFNVPTTASVAIRVDGRTYTTVGVKIDVKAYRNIVVASRNLVYGEILASDAIRMERCEVGHLTGYITDPEKVLGLMVRKPVAAGAPVIETILAKPLIVKRNSNVTIIAQIGDIVVMAGGKALQQGREGEIIRVQNLSSQRVFAARVIDGTTVQVITYSGR
ncbi:MAG TPA: flagellar basal body P-ring formation chaperone FlgA [Selenomonadales bacterium]|nr:flagellar basal body P-ring formation chaperone FlgA [Selenomonadales bacterium]